LTKRNKKLDSGVFHLIAPIYSWFYNSQKRNYGEIIDVLQKNINISQYKKIVDIGCGTGAMCSVLNKRGFNVTGVEPVKRMLDIGKRKQENSGINFVQASALEKTPFSDKSFDVSIASYVTHGLKEHERKLIYNEMNRLTKKLVIIYDYNETRAFFTDIIEWLEGGDYFNFIKNVKKEMNENFSSVNIININSHASLYVCVPKKT